MMGIEMVQITLALLLMGELFCTVRKSMCVQNVIPCIRRRTL